MGISPMYVGQTRPPWQLTVQDDNGTAIDVTGATFALAIRNVATGVDTAGAGVFAILNAKAGLVTYTWVAADTASAGNYQLYVTITLSVGAVLVADPIPWQVLAH